MKKMFFVFLLVGSIMSCEFVNFDKKTNSSNYTISQSRQRLLSIKPEDRRSYFEKLSNSEKVNIFKNKLEQVLQFDWSESQRNILLEASSFLNEDFYKYPKSENYLNLEKEWRKKALKLFSVEQLAGIVTSVDDFEKISDVSKILPPGEKVDEPGCNCSDQSDWCIWGFDCTGTCWVGTSNSGCGTWWGYACNSSCK